MSKRINKKRTLSEIESASTPTVRRTAIFELPSPIFHIIFGEYLILEDVTRFDSAVLNHNGRVIFLRHLFNMITRSFYGKKCTPFLLRWLFQRQIRLSSLEFGYGDNNSIYSALQFFPLNVTALESLAIYDFGFIMSSQNQTHVLTSLRKCTKLKKLDLNNNNWNGGPFVSVDFFTTLKIHSTLECIKLGDCDYEKIFPILASECPKLLELHLTIKSSVSLETLINLLSQRGRGLKKFVIHNNLSFFENQNVITNANTIIIHVGGYCPNLEFFVCYAEINDHALIQLGKSCPLLKHLDISGDYVNLTDTGILALAEGCSQLKYLLICDPSERSSTSDHSFIKLTETCTLLENLTIGNLQLTDESMFAIAKNCKNLKHIQLHELKVTKVGLTSLFSSSNMNCLESVYVSHTAGFTDNVLLALVKNTHATLTSLVIEGEVEVTDAGIYHIATYCKKLVTFTLTYVPYVMLPFYICEVIQSNPRIKSFDYDTHTPNRIEDDKRVIAVEIKNALNANINRV